MFRPLLVSKRRLFPLYRSFCKPSPQEKCYIIKTKDEGKKIVYESQIMKRFREQDQRVATVENSWERLIQVALKILKKGQQQTIVIIKNLKLKEKLLEMKQIQGEKLSSAVAVLKQKLESGQLKEQLIRFQTSDGYKKAQNIPKKILQTSKTGAVKAQHYWGIFMQSESKEKLDKIIIWMWINGKFFILRFIRFIREAYFDKSQVKSAPKH